MKTSLWTVLVVLVGVVLMRNFTPQGRPDIDVIEVSGGVERRLKKYEKVIGKDLEGYRNHIYRVLSYAMHFLQGDTQYQDVIEAALVYHDIGLWTDGELNYLDPSYDVAKKDLQKSFSAEQLELIKNIIIYHHKVTDFEGPHADVVNACRKADWIDASRGMISMGMRRANIQHVQEKIPNAGFHNTLLGFGPRLHGYNVYKIVTELGKIFYW